MEQAQACFKFPAVLRHTSVEWTDCRRNDRQEVRRACHLSAAHPQCGKAVPDRKSWQPQLVPCVRNKCIYELDLVKAQDMDLQFHQTFKYAVCLRICSFPVSLSRCNECSGCQVHFGSPQRMVQKPCKTSRLCFDVVLRTGHDTVAICVVLFISLVSSISFVYSIQFVGHAAFGSRNQARIP